MPAVAALALAVVLTQTAARDPGAAHWDALAIPLLSFNSDVGVGYGAVGGAYFYGEGYAPYRHAVSVQAFWTTGGERNHFITYDGPRLLGPLRLEARLEFRRELLEPFYGAGNLAAVPAPLLNDERLTTYDKLAPGGLLRLRGHPLGEAHPLQLYAGYSYHRVTVHTYGGSLLAAQAPPGLGGGDNGQLRAGALWDTRDNEGNATSGGLHELDVRLASGPTLNSDRFLGVGFTERRFFQLGSPRWVLAERLVLDVLAGQVPFYEWTEFSDMTSPFGLGGMYTLRGIPRDRYAGDVKVLSNTELRAAPYSFRLFRRVIGVGATLFVDAGRVWHPDVPNGPWHLIHTGVGAGLRATYGAAVVRVDWGVALETGRQGLYVTFGQMF